jgi:cellulose synthase/poly-beta-1,6-N-acetylglucosamine synthase-like glycosyltransferase
MTCSVAPYVWARSVAGGAAAAASSGEILVFSDADAFLDPEAVNALIRHFSDPDIGGVCGRRVIGESGSKFGRGQGRYIDWDSRLKELESRCGRITSNDGKLYAIRRGLFTGVAEAVTDDLYVCLSVIERGFHFIFEPQAKALIRVPSRSAKHEVRRRRRIVTRSLRGIYLKRHVLNPVRYGEFAVGLMINKVFRRLIPFAAIGVFLSCCLLVEHYRVFQYLVYSQLALLGMGPVTTLFVVRRPNGFVARKACAAGYFVLGILGTFLGFIDFLTGRKINKWNPIKND